MTTFDRVLKEFKRQTMLDEVDADDVDVAAGLTGLVLNTIGRITRWASRTLLTGLPIEDKLDILFELRIDPPADEAEMGQIILDSLLTEIYFDQTCTNALRIRSQFEQ